MRRACIPIKHEMHLIVTSKWRIRVALSRPHDSFHALPPRRLPVPTLGGNLADDNSEPIHAARRPLRPPSVHAPSIVPSFILKTPSLPARRPVAVGVSDSLSRLPFLQYSGGPRCAASCSPRRPAAGAGWTRSSSARSSPPARGACRAAASSSAGPRYSYEVVKAVKGGEKAVNREKRGTLPAKRR